MYMEKGAGASEVVYSIVPDDLFKAGKERSDKVAYFLVYTFKLLLVNG